MSAPPSQIEESFTLQSEKKIQYCIHMSIQSNSLFIEAKTIDLITSINYKKDFTLEDIKSNKYFKMCDSINEVLLELRNIKKNNLNNIKITENSNKLILTFPLPSYLIQEINFHIERSLNSEKEDINNLYNSIQILSQKINEFEKKQNLNLEKKIEELEKKNETLENTIKIIKQQNTILEEKNNNLENETKQIKEENKNLVNEIKKIKEYLFPESIFKSKISFDENLIKEWIGKKFSSELLFSVSKNGSEPKEFHRLCDNKGPTIIFIETTKGFKFGGYTELDWDKSSSYKTDNSTFLFSLNNKKKYTRRNEMCSIYCREDLAPSFGGNGNPDFYCMGSCSNGRLSNSNTFATPQELNNGESSFNVKEMEVYQIKLL